jgi:hypothetical protein
MANNNTENKSFKEWFEEHKKPILIGGGIFIAVVAGTIVCYKIGKKKSVGYLLDPIETVSHVALTYDTNKCIAENKFKVMNLLSDHVDDIPDFKENVLDKTLDGVVEARDLIDKYFDDLFEKIDPSKIGAISVAYDIV